LCGVPEPVEFEDEVVAAVKWVDGTVIDVIKKVRRNL
jgi:citrate lyase subunit alpha/citrate CoA-transferase